MNFIDEFKKTVIKAIDRFEVELKSENVWLSAKYYNEEVVYGLINFPSKVRDISINEILGVKIDFVGKGYFIGNYIAEKIQFFAIKHQCTTVELTVMFMKHINDVRIMLYKDGKHVEDINLNEL